MADLNQSVWHQVTNVSPPAGTKVTNPGAPSTYSPLVDLGKKTNNETLPYEVRMDTLKYLNQSSVLMPARAAQ